MKYLVLLILLCSRMVFAWCPDEGQVITLQGTLAEHTYPGPPNYESIENGDEAVTNEFIQLDEPLECDLTQENESVAEVQLVFVGKSQASAAQLSPNQKHMIVATGKTMYAHAGRHYTPVLLLMDEVKPVAMALTPELKKSMLAQFQQFQQALRSNDVAAVKSWFLFPLNGDTYGFEPDTESQPYSKLTAEAFDRYGHQIIANLRLLSEVEVNPDTLEIKERRINALSAKEQQRRYFPGDEDGTFYYEENGQRHAVVGTCDEVASGEFNEETLTVYQGTSANNTLPGLSEMCDGASLFNFKLIEGKLRLVSSFTVG